MTKNLALISTKNETISKRNKTLIGKFFYTVNFVCEMMI